MNPTGPHSGTFRPNPRRPFARCRRLLAVLAVLPLLLAGRAFALDPTRSIYQYNCQNWTRHNGLPANKINSITQTRDGYLWLGTPIGLVRFSGLEFKAVPIDLPQAQRQEASRVDLTVVGDEHDALAVAGRRTRCANRVVGFSQLVVEARPEASRCVACQAKHDRLRR